MAADGLAEHYQVLEELGRKLGKHLTRLSAPSAINIRLYRWKLWRRVQGNRQGYRGDCRNQTRWSSH